MPIDELRRLMDRRQFATYFQPILDAASQVVIGYEALARYSTAGQWTSPLDMFETAEQHGCSAELDLLLLELAISRYRATAAPGKVFVNVMPATLFEGDDLIRKIEDLLATSRSAASDIVLEITEHGPPRDPATIVKAVGPLRERGCQIAIDDLGAGTSGLKIWSELRPEFVKIDRYFIDRIESDSVAAEMMRSLLDIAHVMGSRVIAEAVERPSQCELLRKMGVDCVQGYLLGRPAPIPVHEAIPPLENPLENTLPALNCAEELLVHRTSVEPDTRVEDAVAIFQENREWDCIVVVDESRPVGIVRRDKLLTLLSKPLYPEIYNRKPVSRIMDSHPLIVDVRARLDQVSRLVTNSAQSRVNEDFIIARHGNYLGIGHTIDLLRQITAHQVEVAKQCNPLTMLPGNREISEELFRLLALRSPFVICQGDLDYFKPFNDAYGYQQGDQVLLHLADLFRYAASQSSDFVGHVGGDDFILMTRNVDWHARLQDLFETFSASIPNFHSAAHRAQGAYTSHDRNGAERDFPLLTLSIGAVLVDPQRLKNQDDVLACLQRAKNAAKAQQGNALAYDRDGELQLLSTDGATGRASSETLRRKALRLPTEKRGPVAEILQGSKAGR